jgi:hypothetical protein
MVAAIIQHAAAATNIVLKGDAAGDASALPPRSDTRFPASSAARKAKIHAAGIKYLC